MNFTIRVKEGHEETLALIKEICESTNTYYQLHEYSMMVSVNIYSGGNLSAYVSEDHYLSGVYGLLIYNRNRELPEKSLFIPITNIDEIYNL